MTDKTRATSERFGYGWTAAGLPEPVTAPDRLSPARHADGARRAAACQGLVLDAGAGEGIDLASVGLSPGCRAVGVELSPGGIRATAARISTVPRARLVQGNILAMPFRSNAVRCARTRTAWCITPSIRNGAVREIVRTLKPGGMLLIYVYEDFERRGVAVASSRSPP